MFKIDGKQNDIMPKKSEYVRFKNYERKVTVYNLCGFWKHSSTEDNGKQDQKSLIRISIKNILLAVMVVS